MGETQVVFILRQNACPVTSQQNQLCIPKYSGGTATGWTFTSRKGEMGRKKGAIGPMQVQDLVRQIP